MSDEVKTETVELTETVVPVESAKPEAPSREELRSQGWSKAELDSAEKQGRIKKVENQEKAEVKTDAKEEPKAEVAPKQEAKPEEKRKDERRASSLPDFTITDPEKERVFLETFGPGTPVRAMYFRQKNERHARQAAEARARELEAQIQEMKAQIQKVQSVEVDESGNQIDPEDKPLTVKQWKELQAREAEERQRRESEIRQQGSIVAESLKSQEEYAKSIYSDYDDTVKLAKDLLQNIDELLPSKWEKEKAEELIAALQVRAANAHKYGIDDYNAALISYEIGRLHPNYGKSTNHGQPAETQTDGNLDRPESKANGSLTPGQKMKRMEENTQRRVSSASIPAGGGKRTVSVDDVGLKELASMNYEQRKAFREKHPARYAQLMRG